MKSIMSYPDILKFGVEAVICERRLAERSRGCGSHCGSYEAKKRWVPLTTFEFRREMNRFRKTGQNFSGKSREYTIKLLEFSDKSVI
jgi:hypothetical protein